MLKTYDNFTLNSMFRPKAFIKKNMRFNVNYIVSVPPSCSMFFLIMAFGQNIELRVNYRNNLKRFETDSEQSLN